MEICETPTLVFRSTIEESYRRLFPIVARFVSQHGGSFEEARDIFHDAMIVYLDKQPRIQQSDEAYLLGVAKNLWYARFKDHLKFSPLKDSFDTVEKNDAHTDASKLYSLLAKAGKRCLDLLEAFYFRENKLNDVVKEFGFGGVHSASVQKFKCIEKLRAFVKSKSLGYEDFMGEDR